MSCTCVKLPVGTVLERWHVRVLPVVSRMLKRGRKVPMANMTKIAALIYGFANGNPESVDPANAWHSHHFKTCPLHPASCATVPRRNDIVSSGSPPSRTAVSR